MLTRTAGARLVRSRTNPYREWIAAIVLGAVGFVLNTVEIPLGWGLHFIFGNALVLAFLRILPPGPLVLASAIASSWSIFLWGHPWAWGVWTIEAIVLSRYAQQRSLVKVDILFWVFAGTPLLMLTYGWIMAMDRPSLSLVIGKQAVNAVLNVAVAELVYLGLLLGAARRNHVPLRKVPMDAVIQMVLMLTILVPTVGYLALEAPGRERNARTIVGHALDSGLDVSAAGIGSWRQSHELMLESFANARMNGAPPQPRTVGRLLADFDRVFAIGRDGQLLWQFLAPDAGQGVSRVHGRINHDVDGAGLRVMADWRGVPRLALSVPISGAGGDMVIVALVRPDAIGHVLGNAVLPGVGGLYLVGDDGTVFDPRGGGVGALPLRMITADLMSRAQGGAILAGPSGFGNSVMTDLKRATMVRARPLPGLPGWSALAAAPLEEEVMRARLEQLKMFISLFGLVVLMMVLGDASSRKITANLRRIAQAAADLALSGTRRQQIDDLVIRELSDISVNLATADSEVARERGALVNYQRRLESIARHAPVVVYALSPSSQGGDRLLYISDGLDKMLGYRPDEAGRHGWLLRKIHPEDRERYQQAVAELEPDRAIGLEYRIRHRKGQWIWIYDTIAPSRDPYFGHPETVGLMIDVTDRKAAAQQLLQSDKMAGLGRLVAGIAHELNQPLNFIQLASTNLRERVVRNLADRERLIQKLDQVLSHVGRASLIIQQMRAFGQPSIEPVQPVRVARSIEGVLTMVRPQIAGSGTRIDITGVNDDLMVRAQPVPLEQVLVNLLINAHDAIRTRRAENPAHEGRITVTARAEDGEAVLSVEDNGSGIPKHLLAMLFEPFFTTKGPKEGMGLGLSISYGIVRDLNGSITAENTGNGARFTVRLPLIGQRAVQPV